jgi:hypothetical protein
MANLWIKGIQEELKGDDIRLLIFSVTSLARRSPEAFGLELMALSNSKGL